MTRAGFTLIEVLVAMVIAALAVSMASAIFGASSDTVRDVVRVSRDWTLQANRFRWLAHVVGGIEVENSPEGAFDGGPRRLRFRSRYWVPSGWLEAGVMTLALEGTTIVATLPNADRVVVADSLSDASFDYLLQYGAESPWLLEWRSRRTAPVAIRLRLLRPDQSEDTMLLFVGDRR